MGKQLLECKEDCNEVMKMLNTCIFHKLRTNAPNIFRWKQYHTQQGGSVDHFGR